MRHERFLIVNLRTLRIHAGLLVLLLIFSEGVNVTDSSTFLSFKHLQFSANLIPILLFLVNFLLNNMYVAGVDLNTLAPILMAYPVGLY